MKCAHNGIVRIFERFRECTNPAYLHQDDTLTYRQLYHSAVNLARLLNAGRGVPPRPVIIHGHRSPKFIVAYWAALLAGRPIVPVERDQSAARIGEIIELTRADCVLLGEPLDTHLPKTCRIRQHDISISEELQHQRAPIDDWQCSSVPDDQTAYILFSSGTTGRPKGIEISYANVADFINWVDSLRNDLRIADDGCISGNIRYCFDVSLFEMWLAWIHRLPMTVLDHRDLWNIGRYINRFARHGLTTWISTPALTRHYVRHGRFNRQSLPNLRTMLFCGEILPNGLVAELFERFPGVRIFNTYGPTECTVAVTIAEITRDLLDDASLPIGRPRTGTFLNYPSSDDEHCEIVISGASVGKGYIGADLDQAAKFQPSGSYRTGDWGSVTATGNWYFHGRKDREVKVEGYRIDLNAVESAIRRINGVEEVIVTPPPAGSVGSGLNAYIVGPATSDSLMQIATRVSATLAPYMVPRYWRRCSNPIFNASGKLDGKKLLIELNKMAPDYVHSPRSIAAE